MLIDAHTHIDKYAGELDEALRQIDVYRILTICVGMDIPSYLKAKELARLSGLLVPTFGIHPWQARHYCEDLGRLDPYLEQTPIIGEAGLDFFWATEEEYYPCQRKVFRYQCEWAQRLSKPMNLHTKGAEQEILQTLSEFQLRGSIIHWYSGPLALIDAYLTLGCYFTLGVEILTSTDIQEIAGQIPLERILLETDNPGGYEWLAGPIGMPIILLDVLSKVAEVKGTDPTSLELQLTKNWQEFSAGIEELKLRSA
jgi:TatD DNase family protein